MPPAPTSPSTVHGVLVGSASLVGTASVVYEGRDPALDLVFRHLAWHGYVEATSKLAAATNLVLSEDEIVHMNRVHDMLVRIRDGDDDVYPIYTWLIEDPTVLSMIKWERFYNLRNDLLFKTCRYFFMKSVVEGENCFLSKGLDEKNNGFNDTTGNDDNFVKNGTKDFEMRDSAPQSSSWKHMSTDMRAEQLAQFITTHHREIGECMTCWMLVFDDSAVKMNANTCDGNNSSGEIGTDGDKDADIGKKANFDRLKPA